jgi:DMSO/TMAO reductase YedYZ molybdopterin-dependent catalytic subunit
VDPAVWSLELGGTVSRPLSLSLDDLRSRPAVDLVATMECAGNGRARLEPRPFSQPWLQEAVGTARWRGVPLASLLAEVEPLDSAVEVAFTGLDGGVEGGVPQRYARALRVEDALDAEVLLAYEMNGVPLPPQHGFPLRLVVPGWYGMTNVKWLARIDVLERTFDGYQQVTGYRMRADEDDAGTPVTRMVPRALLVPPGEPDFHTRVRHLPPGPVALEGRAWSGLGRVARVEVSADGGASWWPAALEDEDGSRWAWRRFTTTWEAEPGEHILACRAADDAGNEQPLDPPWNVGGYANNAVHRIPVVVAP